MTTPAKINFKVYQGSTFSEVLRWESSSKGYKTITGISNTAPVVITSTAHGIPVDWRIKLSNIVGMTEMNLGDTYQLVTGITSNTLTINAINALSYRSYVSGGVIEYNLPVDLTGFTGRMQLRSDIDSTVVIAELTTANGGVSIDNTLKNITLMISSGTTATFNFITAVYNLELSDTN